MADKVLLVDDDANLLAALARHFRKQFPLSVATGGMEALKVLKSDGPFAVVVCDMRMPGMDGIATLQAIKEAAPDTVRIMLTGNADQQTAIAAINEGSILRFYTKPCPPEVLAEGIEAGLRQHRLVTAERELLERTLAGSVKVLVDVLSMIDPESFGRATRMRDWAGRLAGAIGFPQPWQLEMAALLAPIGMVSVPPELLAKVMAGEAVDGAERDILDRIPEAGAALIANIPRMKAVSEMVLHQNRGFDGSGFPAEGPSGEAIPLGGRVLKILGDLSRLAHGPHPGPAAFDRLERSPAPYDLRLLRAARQALARADVEEDAEQVVELPVALLRAGYLIRSDIRFADGRLFLAAPARLSEVQVQRLRNMAKIEKFNEPVQAVRAAV